MNARTVDFLNAPGPPRVGWVLLAAGAVALTTSLWYEKQWAVERLAAARAEQAATAAQQAQRQPVAPPAPTLLQQRWQQAEPELQRPWLPALRAVEAAAVNPVFLLSMTIEPAKGLIRLDAEAPSFDHALAFVQVLDQGKLLMPATLVSHEQTGDPASGSGRVKFSATTRWMTP